MTNNVTVPRNRGQSSLKVIGTDTYRSATYGFLLTFHSNHGPISNCLRWTAIWVENRKIFPPRVFYAPTEGVPLELATVAGVKKLEWWGYRAEKKFDDIFSHVDTIHQHTNIIDRQTDGRTPDDSKDLVYT